MTQVQTQPPTNIVLAITGASGAIYAVRLLQVLGVELDFVSAMRRPTLSSILEERRHNANVGPDSR